MPIRSRAISISTHFLRQAYPIGRSKFFIDARRYFTTTARSDARIDVSTRIFLDMHARETIAASKNCKTWCIVVLLLGTVVILLGISWLSWIKYWIVGYSGDGVFHDFGAFSRPRFEIAFHTVEFKDGAHTYTVAGAPPCPMLVGVNVLSNIRKSGGGSSHTVARIVQSSGATLQIRIQSEDGQVIYDRTDRVSKWNYSESKDRVYMWLDGYSTILDPWTSYSIELVITLDDGIDQLGTITLQPFLAGGGSEL